MMKVVSLRMTIIICAGLLPTGQRLDNLQNQFGVYDWNGISDSSTL